MDVGSISPRSSAFSLSSVYIWKFLIHILWSLAQRVLSITLLSMWNEHNCAVLWVIFGIALLCGDQYFVMCTLEFLSSGIMCILQCKLRSWIMYTVQYWLSRGRLILPECKLSSCGKPAIAHWFSNGNMCVLEYRINTIITFPPEISHCRSDTCA